MHNSLPPSTPSCKLSPYIRAFFLFIDSFENLFENLYKKTKKHYVSLLQILWNCANILFTNYWFVILSVKVWSLLHFRFYGKYNLLLFVYKLKFPLHYINQALIIIRSISVPDYYLVSFLIKPIETNENHVQNTHDDLPCIMCIDTI